MITLADLHQTVQKALKADRIGTPVYVRYHLQNLLKKEALEKIVPLIEQWMGAKAELRHTLNNENHHSWTLQWKDGRTASLSALDGTDAVPGPHLMVIGNHGAIYHRYDGGSDYLWEDVKPISSPDESKPSKEKAKPKYGVLLVTGSYTHQENYARAFADDPRCKLIALTDEKKVSERRRKLNQRLADELGIPHEPDLTKALHRDDVDIVSICAPPERRGRIAVQCAKAGKHLYLDKSLVPQLSEADALVKAVEQAKVQTHMFCFISQPWAIRAKTLIDSGKMGKLLGIHADTFFAKGRPGTAKLGKARKEEFPPQRHQLKTAKRELDNVGVYPITLIHWLTGQKFESVQGIAANYFFAEHQKHNVEDFGLLTCTLANDIPVTVSAGRYGWTTHPNFGVNRLLLVGSKQTALIDANHPHLEVYNDGKPWIPPNVNPDDPMGFWSSSQAAVHTQPKTTWLPFHGNAQSDVAYFLDQLDAGKSSEMSITEAAHSAEVLIGGYLSASNGKQIQLPLKRGN